MFADVIVDIQHEKLDKIFQYRIPEELESRLQPGMEVVVPFGKGNRQIKGYVTGFSEKCEYDLSKVKSILSISEKGMEIETRLIALAAWMKEHYGGTMIQSLKTVLPIRQKENAKVKKHLRLLLSEKEGEEKAKEQNADGDYADNSVSWRFVCVCNPRFTKGCIAEGKRESSGTF